MYIGRHVKYPLSLLDFSETWISSKEFVKIFKFNENQSGGAELFHAGGQTWRSQ
jgi:hypothetical protein